MTLDFAEYLLDYTKRFFLKGIDMLGLSIALIALFVSMAAMIMSLSVEHVQQNSVQCMNQNTFLPYAAAGILAASLIPVIIIVYRHKNNNKNVFEIEKIFSKL